MDQKIDVIGIGAINIDYIFDDIIKSTQNERNTAFDSGEENFVTEERFKMAFDNAVRNSNNGAKTQIGGSALLAIKTLKTMSSDLRTAYVGVYGEIPNFPANEKLPTDSTEIKTQLLKFIDDTTWLFDDKSRIGCALVMLKNHKRDHINVCSGANDLLFNKIKEKGYSDFVSFLSTAKWIHMSSLHDIKQFCNICELVKKAKEINPHLIFSIDPGYDYTKNHCDKLIKIFHIADYVFLNEKEKNNIWTYLNLGNKDSFTNFGQELINIKANPQIIIIKNTSKVILLNMIAGSPFTRTYHHPKINKIKIANDTGAGDAFAGGFISGMLAPTMLSYQPAPIKLGISAARERLMSENWPSNLKHMALEFHKKSMKEEEKNTKQLFKDKFWPKLQLVIGILAGWFADSIFDFIRDLIINS